ncbi:DUF4383 domain-containing protein [Mycobacterium paraseoulense]|nr:DUF4383 domain-containing protein [Mycobacterium paraseoulense]
MSAFGIAGLVSAVLHPHAGPTGAPVLGLTSAPAHSAIVLALGVAAIAAVGHRRAAVTVTALSAVAYTMLLFFSSVATARTTPTPLGFHAADIVLHGLLAVVNFALLMWLIPDELGDEAWVPRQGRDRDPHQRPPSEAVPGPAAAYPGVASPTEPGSPPAGPAAGAPEAGPAPSVDVRQPPHALREQSRSQHTNKPSAPTVETSPRLDHYAERATDGVLSRGVALAVVAALTAVVGIVIWARRRSNAASYLLDDGPGKG